MGFHGTSFDVSAQEAKMSQLKTTLSPGSVVPISSPKINNDPDPLL